MKGITAKAFLFLAVLILFSSLMLLIQIGGGENSDPPWVNPPQANLKKSTILEAYADVQESYPTEAPDRSPVVTFKGNALSIAYDITTGTADFYHNGQTIIHGFFSQVLLDSPLTSKDYPTRTVQSDGQHHTVVLTGEGMPTMNQHFEFKEDYVLFWVELSDSALSTRYMAPLVVDTPGGVDLGLGKEMTALWIPFDNDRNAKFEAATLNREDTSYEAAAFYENTSRKGLVVGSVTHDTWKTGISFKGSGNKLDHLEVFGGVSIRNSGHDGTMIRDVQAHGAVSGNLLISPKIFVGHFKDWRDGMERYAEANLEVMPGLSWDGGVPFGWNSWGAVGDKLNTDSVVAASDFISDSLMDKGFTNNGTTYINLDSYWDSASVDLETVVARIHENGQKAGIYWAPFVDWIKDPNRRVEGTSFTYKDIWLKNDKGEPITYGYGPYALDLTHPGTLKRIDYFIGLFKSKGFDSYIKTDFLSHGALEGRFHNPRVTTGMQAYNAGMEYLYKTIQTVMGPQTFISQAISPLFPYQYAHARRISCDKFGYIYETRDLMNSVAYGWWMNDGLYCYNDPDHLTLYQAWWNSDEKMTENEAKSRVTSGVVAGTVFLSGDDFSNSAAMERAIKMLTQPRINEIARKGKAFRPLEGNTGTDAPEWFVLKEEDGTVYLAVFNFNGGASVKKTLDLTRAGMDPFKEYEAIEQWSGASTWVKGKLTITLGPAEAQIYALK